MKTAKLIRLSGLFLLCFIALGGFSSCDSDDWDPAPPPGWNSFYDDRLDGTWELVEANGRPVVGTAVNYVSFYGNGTGRYYYYNNGQQFSEKMAYWCQVANNGVSRYQMNMKYEYTNPSTVNYWFTNNPPRLWMQWGTGAGIVTYGYRFVEAPGW